MKWALLMVALGALSAVVRMASPPLLCRLGLHVRPLFSTSSRWVCRRCPAMHDSGPMVVLGVDDEA